MADSADKVHVVNRTLVLAVSALVAVACGGVDERVDGDEIVAQAQAHTVIHAARDIIGERMVRLGDLIRHVDDTRPIEQSPALDLEHYQLSDDQVCGGHGCPAVADLRCEAYTAGAQVICACRHEGYLFVCR